MYRGDCVFDNDADLEMIAAGRGRYDDPPMCDHCGCDCDAGTARMITDGTNEPCTDVEGRIRYRCADCHAN